MLRKRTRGQAGFTLLEVVTASAMMAALMTSGVVLLRTSQGVWEAHQEDHARLEAGQKLVRHIVRRVRQAEAVVAVSDASNVYGNLTLLMPDGKIYAWAQSGNLVMYGADTASNVLAQNIDTLRFIAYEADGSTITTDPAKAQSIQCIVTVTLPRGSGELRVIRSHAWRRAW